MGWSHRRLAALKVLRVPLLREGTLDRQRAPDGRETCLNGAGEIPGEIPGLRFLRRADLVQYPVGLGCDTGIFRAIPTGKAEILDRFAPISLLRVNFAESERRK